MNAIRTVAALSLAALATACASPGATDATPAAGMSPGMSHGGAPMPMAAMEPRMKAMKEELKWVRSNGNVVLRFPAGAAMKDMHQKMMAAKSPAERQSLMADHMKAMQDGMAMMKEMHGGMGGMSGMAGMDHSKGMPAGMAQRHQMMTEHMAMMQMMMDMMMQRMPASPVTQ